MSLAKQVGLLAAGCQPWNSDVCAANGDRFAYCATLSIYIYQFDYQYKEFRLHSIISEHKKTITAIAWSHRNADLLASASCDNQVLIYNISSQKVIARLENTQHAPTSIGWCPHEKDCITFAYGKGPLFVWNHAAPGHGLSQHKEAQNFQSNICQFRWHPKKMGKVVFGHMDGSISFHCPGQKAQRHMFRPEDLDSAEEEDPVVALEWDPLSIEYLLMVNTYLGIRLIDTESITVISKFQLPSVAAQVHTLAWIHTAPGMFLTGDTHTGVMRVWSVAKMTPVESLKLKKKGFHALHVVTATGQSEVGVPGLSSVNSPSAVPGSYTLPPGHALCTFQDGGVGLYDLGRRKWNFLRDQGHVETIFDCKFHPDDPDILSTASFDGTIKIWNVNTLTPINTSPGNEGVIYCVSWAPADLNCIAASTSRQGVFIWDIKKNKVIKRFNEHGKVPVYSVAWNNKDSRLVASCGGDGFCIVRHVDGTPFIKYKHPGVVFGCDWSPLNKDMIATGCEDKNVRVFYMATNSEQPLKTFSGHTGKVFHVRWSPLRDGVLCSGSDDGTIRIWDYTQDGCMMLLAGHTAPVRGLLWNPEIPYLLVSGSWDFTIRIWDARDGACVDRILDHGADVYGLTTHPNRPFVMASCSRDSTLRLWSLTALVQPLEINILVERSWNEIIVALDLKHRFAGIPQGRRLYVYEHAMSKFFYNFQEAAKLLAGARVTARRAMVQLERKLRGSRTLKDATKMYSPSKRKWLVLRQGSPKRVKKSLDKNWDKEEKKIQRNRHTFHQMEIVTLDILYLAAQMSCDNANTGTAVSLNKLINEVKGRRRSSSLNPLQCRFKLFFNLYEESDTNMQKVHRIMKNGLQEGLKKVEQACVDRALHLEAVLPASPTPKRRRATRRRLSAEEGELQEIYNKEMEEKAVLDNLILGLKVALAEDSSQTYDHDEDDSQEANFARQQKIELVKKRAH